MSQDPGADRVLEVLQKLVGEGCGFVEVEVGIEAGAEAMEKAHGSEGSRGRSRLTGQPQPGLVGPEQNVEDSAGGLGHALGVA